jgi:hypothetical protein
LHQTRAPIDVPVDRDIHGRIVDSVMGLVCLDNLLFIGRYYERIPEEVLVIEAEPADETWGNELSSEVASLVEPAAHAVLAALQSWPER